MLFLSGYNYTGPSFKILLNRTPKQPRQRTIIRVGTRKNVFVVTGGSFSPLRQIHSKIQGVHENTSKFFSTRLLHTLSKCAKLEKRKMGRAGRKQETPQKPVGLTAPDYRASIEASPPCRQDGDPSVLCKPDQELKLQVQGWVQKCPSFHITSCRTTTALHLRNPVCLFVTFTPRCIFKVLITPKQRRWRKLWPFTENFWRRS